MNSALFALFLRSLRHDARARRTYWARTILGVFVLLVVFQFALTNGWVGAPGRAFLLSVITLQLLAITFIGLSYFTSAIAEEKEEQMLGLLRMTDLSSLSILLGKSTSRLCGALLLLTAQIPFTIFAITLGGVSFRQVAAVYCALAAYTFFLCNLALLGSVLARRTAGATGFCLAVMALLFWSAHFFGFIRDAMPFARLAEVLGAGFDGSLFGGHFASNLAGGIGCFLLAWALFGRFCDRAPDGASGVGRPVLGRFGRRWPRRPRVWKRAPAWKDFYFLCGGRLGFALRVLGYGAALLAVICEALGYPGFRQASDRLIPWITFIFSLELAVMASRIFRVELNDHTLASLATIPCGMPEIARAKAHACLVAAIPGAVATFVTELLEVCRAPGSNAWMQVFVFFSLWIALLFLIHLVAWLSLRMKRGALPVGYLITCVAFSFLFGFCGMIVATMLQSMSGESASWQGLVALILPMIICAMLALGPAWMLRGAIPPELAELAGEE